MMDDLVKLEMEIHKEEKESTLVRAGWFEEGKSEDSLGIAKNMVPKDMDNELIA